MKIRHLIITLSIYILASCSSTEEHNHEGHNHDQEEGHDHEKQTSSQRPIVDYTLWTNKTELFVEFPTLVVGKKSKFTSYFTQLNGYNPIKEGSVKVSLLEGKMRRSKLATKPLRDGVFQPALTPQKAGFYSITFILNSSSLQDTITMDSVQVFNSVEEIKQSTNTKKGDEISFSKEQAWNIDFQTVPVQSQVIYDVISTSGVWRRSSSDVKTLVATTNGQVTFNTKNLIEGANVVKGQLLMTVSSKGFTTNNLSSEILKAKADFEQAKAEYERKKKLYSSKIIPKAEFEKVQQKYTVAKSNYQTLSAGYASGGKKIIAPFNGYIKSIALSNGDFADQGANLITLSTSQSSLLEVYVNPSRSSELSNINNIWYQPQQGTWSDMKSTHGSVVSIDKTVDREHPLLSVFASINDPITLPEGSLTPVQIAVGKESSSLTIPKKALLEDYGKFSVIVQLSGESFERRPVTIGKRNGDSVEIIKGLSLGEVVVTNGAYQVKMASMSGEIPAHGHSH